MYTTAAALPTMCLYSLYHWCTTHHVSVQPLPLVNYPPCVCTASSTGELYLSQIGWWCRLLESTITPGDSPVKKQRAL